jgi:hypothetical protein
MIVVQNLEKIPVQVDDQTNKRFSLPDFYNWKVLFRIFRWTGWPFPIHSAIA